MLHSLNAVTKGTTEVVTRFGWSTPDPGFGSGIELSRRDPGGLFDLVGRGLALPSQSIAAKEAPPAFLEVEPTCSSGNEDVAGRIVGFDVLKEGYVVRRVA